MNLLVILGLGFLCSVGASYGWLRLALAQSWFDFPNQRSSHSNPTPKAGGVGFALVFVILAYYLSESGAAQRVVLWLAIPGLCLAVVGLLDDVCELGIVVRLLSQLCAVLVALLLLPGLPESVFPSQDTRWGILGLCLLGLCWIWHINLFNFMDGIDGLAVSEGIFVTLAYGWFSFQSGRHDFGVVALVFAAIMGGFLLFNWSPARLFMGDAGSNFLGYILIAHGLLLVQNSVITIWTMLLVLGPFIADSSLTLVKRMLAGRVWYHGHRSHAYQLLAGAWQSHAKVVLGFCALNVFWLLPLAWLSVVRKELGLVLVLMAYLPLLLLVDRCHHTFMSDGIK